VLLSSWGSLGTPGVTDEYVDIDPDVTISYRYPFLDRFGYNSYVFQVDLGIDIDPTKIEFRGIVVYWHRQVSAAPATATFADVPTGHPFFRFVEALVASGITAGCGGGNYCPDDPLTRGQMAVFLSAALGLHWAP
jgi:hypothetical protein